MTFCMLKKATQNVFRKKIPFRSFKIINRNEETLGELFTFCIRNFSIKLLFKSKSSRSTICRINKKRN